MKKIIPTFIVSAIFGVVSLTSQVAAAGNASMFISSSASSAVNGSTFTVTISENAAAAQLVAVDLSYDASQVQPVGGFSCSSAFPTQNFNSCAIASGSASATGTQVVGSQTYKVLGSAGSARITIATSSYIANNGVDEWNHAATSTSVTMTAPATTPSNPSTPTAPATGNGGSTTPGRGAGSTPTTSTGSTTGTTNGSTSTGSTATGSTSTGNTPAPTGSATTPPTTGTATTPVTGTPNKGTSTTSPQKPSKTPYVLSALAAIIAAIGGSIYGAFKRPDLFPTVVGAMSGIRSYFGK